MREYSKQQTPEEQAVPVSAWRYVAQTLSNRCTDLIIRTVGVWPDLHCDGGVIAELRQSASSTAAHSSTGHRIGNTAWRIDSPALQHHAQDTHRHCTYTRIDLFLMNKWLLQKVTQTKITNITWSVHASVLLTLGDTYPNDSAYMWRSNSQIIQNAATKEILEGHLSDLFSYQILYYR